MLAHQIAAGEIVERPASVVKELVENSIDAEASNITVELSEGGKSRIRVKDDGVGMTREDAELAFEHHATSKISTIEDLQEIDTLGFRGEALPSIASVSRLRVRTASREDRENDPNPLGWEIVYEGGSCLSSSEIAWPAGTEILVEDIFFNIPVRKKFLKTQSTELSHVSRFVTSYALVSPSISFSLEHEGRKMLDAPAVSSIQDRIFQIFGEKTQSNLVEMDYERHGIKVKGVTSLPHEQKNNANSMYLFVNGRLVRDKVLTHAIRFAYQDQMPHSSYPFTVLFISIPPGEIDVNVHPAKTELRFNDSRKVHSAIFHAVEEALLLKNPDPSLAGIARDIEPGTGRREDYTEQNSRPEPFSHPGSAGFPRRRVPSDYLPLGRHSDFSRPFPDGSTRADFEKEYPGATAGPAPSSDPDEDQEHPSEGSAGQRILGQFKESFIVATDKDGLMIIDQHVAHERILYEQALRALETREGMASQALLFPETISLTPEQSALAEHFIQHLNGNGYDIDWFGSATIVVRAVPVLARDADTGELIEDLLQDSGLFNELAERDSSEKVSRLREKMAISISCKAAIKVNTVLSREKMEWLVDALFQCRNPYTCPHGRPIVLRLGMDEILKGFKRT